MPKILLLCSLFCLCFVGCQKNSTPNDGMTEASSNNPVQFDVFLRDAILQGISQDNVPLDVIQDMLNMPIYVTKCPICQNVQSAFKQYSGPTPTETSTLPIEIQEKLQGDTNAQKQALQLMVSRYVEQHFERLDLSRRNRARLEKQLKKGREKGMTYKQDSFGDYCPSCDGACRMPQSPPAKE